jgi:hypothetical protein
LPPFTSSIPLLRRSGARSVHVPEMQRPKFLMLIAEKPDRSVPFYHHNFGNPQKNQIYLPVHQFPSARPEKFASLRAKRLGM